MAKSGAPTRAERREQQMADAFSTMSKAMDLQSQTMSKLVTKIEGEPEKEQTRVVDSPRESYEPTVVPQAPVGKPAVIYKCASRGLWQVIKPSDSIDRGNGNTRIVPPLYALFENSTFRTSDPNIVKMVDAAIAYRESLGAQAIITKLKDEIAEALADKNTDIKPIQSSDVTHQTSVEELIQ